MKPLLFWTLPNLITWYRVVVAVPIILLIVQNVPSTLWIAFILMILAEISDGMDGYLARRYKQVSSVGKILDPMADSLYRISVFTAFSANHWMPIWMFLIMVWRDVGVSYLRVIAEQKIGTLGARQSGKWKAIAQGFAQISVVFIEAFWWPNLTSDMQLFTWCSLFLASLVTAYSLVDYGVIVLRKLP